MRLLVPFEKLGKGLVYLTAANVARKNIGRSFSTANFFERFERDLPTARPAAQHEFETLKSEFGIEVVPETFQDNLLTSPQKQVLDTLVAMRVDYVSAQRILLSCALSIAHNGVAMDDYPPDFSHLLPVAEALELSLDQFRKIALQVNAFGMPPKWSK